MGEGLATRRERAVACGLPGGGGASQAARMASGSDLPDLSDPREIFPGMSDPREMRPGKNLGGQIYPIKICRRFLCTVSVCRGRQIRQI